ncbi:MAG: hypothetical protein KC776_01765 [Myxococcales bacterium]|nr:hypothetical protein [Myxococcales bacterium]MCB9583063.1 hypothetical protein [Polyangiaceae bacterium]
MSLAATTLALASCLVSEPALTPETPAAERIRAEPARPHPVVVLVALDGVRWQEVFLGVDPALSRRFRLPANEVVSAEELMPNLHRIIDDEGAALGAPGAGAPMVASGPNFVSLPGYLELFRGRRHSPCTKNDCLPTEDLTLVDEVAQRAGGWATEVSVIASWAGISKAAARHPERLVVSTGRHGGPTRHFLRYDTTAARLLDAGARSSAYPGHGDYRPDRYTSAIALRYLETQTPRFLFVGLGDSDAYAHHGLYRDYLTGLRNADATIGEIDRVLSELRARGYPATLLVTADHGRGKRFAGHGAVAPESARVWLVASGSGITARREVAAPKLRRLADVAPTIRSLMRLPPAEPAVDQGEVLSELFGQR